VFEGIRWNKIGYFVGNRKFAHFHNQQEMDVRLTTDLLSNELNLG